MRRCANCSAARAPIWPRCARSGLPVPPGFTITTEACNRYYANSAKFPEALKAQVEKALAAVARKTGRKFGDDKQPLLVSVRSGRARLDAGHDGHRPQSRPQ